MDTILERDQYMCIYRTAYLSVLSCAYALYQQQYSLAIVPGSVFLTSIHYWKQPDYSYRRYLDMAVVNTAAIYQYYRALNAEYANLYSAFFFMSVASYVLGVYYYNKKAYWNSTYAHMSLHILANIGNLVLYSGHVNLTSDRPQLTDQNGV
jgi:hypothetical protein